MKLSLEPVTREGCELARQWRNAALETLRTPFPLTREQQEAFYQSLQDRVSPHRYWLVEEEGYIVGQAGLTNIDWYNGCAEISLIVSPNERGKGIGKGAVDLVLGVAFLQMRLHMVYGEVYCCNPAVDFWKEIVRRYEGFSTFLEERKWWNGEHWPSYYFSIDETRYRDQGNVPDDLSGDRCVRGVDESFCADT